MATPKPHLLPSHIKDKLSIKQREYMKDRVIHKMNQYTQKGGEQKTWYQLTSIVGIVCSATVPVLINLEVDAMIPTILSLIVTILVSMEKLFHFREHWRNYDAIAGFLRSEQVQFQTLAGVYAKKATNPKNAFRLFVTRIEEGIKDERNDTIEMRTKENE